MQNIENINTELESLKYTPAMEISTAVMDDILNKRKAFFNEYYERVVKGLKRNSNTLMKAISKYQDKHIEVLSSPYMLNYCVFGADDAKSLFEATGISENELIKTIKELKSYIKDQAKIRGFVSTVDWKNITPFRVLLLLAIRFYVEKGDKKKLKAVCAYYGYSMYFTMFSHQFTHGVRKETMVYTVNNLSNKFILKKTGSVGQMLWYGVDLSIATYQKKLMNCTDNDLIYIINQLKTRVKGYIKNVATIYYDNDTKKNAIFTSQETITTEEGTDFIDRKSSSGDIEKNAQKYSSLFFAKPIDSEINMIVSRMNQISRQEMKNALTLLRSDERRIKEVKEFYDSIFYLYMKNDTSASMNIHSKKFLAETDTIYKKGNSKNKNIIRIKQLIDKWLQATSKMYREANRAATLNNLRKGIYQYFIFLVVLRK